MNWKDAYERQMEIWEFFRTPHGKSGLTRWARAECLNEPSKKKVMDVLLPMEEDKLLNADPIYVAEEMVDLIEFARKSWINEPFVEQDVIVPHAFVYLARPTYILDRHGNEVNVRAISWSPCTLMTEEGEVTGTHGLAMTMYSSLFGDERDLDDQLREVAESFRRAGHVAPHLTPLHIGPVWFNVDPTEEMVDVDHPDERTGAEEWWSLVQVLLRMMTQTVAVRERTMVDRHSRKRGIRRGFEPREVTVVKLRRPKHAPKEGGTGLVDWTHRWIVGSFWRNQWYPSLGLHRQIWIDAYVKGPDDLPLIVKRRAYEWTR